MRKRYLLKFAELLLLLCMLVATIGDVDAATGTLGPPASFIKDTIFTVNHPDFFKPTRRPNIFVVDIKQTNSYWRRTSIEFTCASGPESLELNLTFSGMESRIERVRLCCFIATSRGVILIYNIEICV